MDDLDDIAARKQREQEERKAEQQRKRDARANERAAKQQAEKGAQQVSQALVTAFARINAVERKAQQALEQRIGGRSPLEGAARILSAPGLRTAPGLNRARADKVTDRPKGKDGAVSFHFSVTTVSKQGELAAVLKGQKSAAAAKSTATPHQKYIERDEAAERLPAVSDFQAYIENDEKAERAPDQADGAAVASFGTIGRDPAERMAFWKAVEESEATPSAPIVTFAPDADPQFWQRLMKARDAGQEFPEALEKALQQPGASQHRITEEQGLDILVALNRHGLASRRKKTNGSGEPEALPVSFNLGRGGRVQIRLVTELPHEMTAAQRFELAQAFAQSYRDKGLPFWAVIHAPNEHNDARNYHLHLNLYDRPATRMKHPQTGQEVWDFEVIERFVTPRRQTRTRRPHQQPKLRDIASIGWVKAERARFARVANEHLARAGLEKRYDARTYVEMGVTDKARERIPPAAFARERKGLPTQAGIKLATEQWDRTRDSVAGIAQADDSYDTYRAEWLVHNLRDITPRQTNDALIVKKEAKALVHRAAEKSYLVLERNAHAYMAARVASRARLVPKKKRTPEDEAALAVAADLTNEARGFDYQIDLLIRKIARIEKRLIAAVQADRKAKRAEGPVRLRQRTQAIVAQMQNLISDDLKAHETDLDDEQSAAAMRQRIMETAKARLREQGEALMEDARAAAEAKRPAPPPPLSPSQRPAPLDDQKRPGTPKVSNPSVPQLEKTPERNLSEEEAEALLAKKQKELKRHRLAARQSGIER